ncbi:MAG TPA: hypothetical protein VGF06_13815 [Terriglobales bacterium]|jgi:hypothetical protein
MSTRANLLLPGAEAPATETRPPAAGPQDLWDRGRFAQEQIHRLVRQLFFPGWPKPVRHVVFAGIDHDPDIAGLCLQVGEILARQVPCRIGVVEASLKPSDFADVFGLKNCSQEADPVKPPRSLSHQISNHLWLVPPESFWESQEQHFSLPEMESATGQLHHDFDYTVLHAPPAALGSEAALLGHLSDGIVLVLEANATRRAAAQKVKEMLLAANIRVLGAVLSGRTFPIPERVYRRL